MFILFIDADVNEKIMLYSEILLPYAILLLPYQEKILKKQFF